MKYLQKFNVQLSQLMTEHQLEPQDVARLCHVDASVVEAWLLESGAQRCYPTVDQLIDLCIQTGTGFDSLIDLDDVSRQEQMELPGFNLIPDNDLQDSLDRLDEHMQKLVLTQDEMELLKRYRASDEATQQLIIQLAAH